MPPTYDPRRSRPGPPTSPPEEAAPIDALLGPEPEQPLDAADDGSAPYGGAPGPSHPTPAPAPKAGAPSLLVQLSPLLVLMAIVGVVVWWLTRRRDR